MKISKVRKKLEARQADYDLLPIQQKRAYKRPGSLNPKKQSAGSARKGRR